MYYLNTNNAAIETGKVMRRSIFIDKTDVISKVWSYSRDVHHYIAVTRPRRFGKTIAANMIAAFFGKGQETKGLFHGKKVAQDTTLWAQQNKYNVIQIDFLAELGETNDYDSFIQLITKRLIQDLCQVWPSLAVTQNDTLSSLLAGTGESFIFVFDEWDAVFSHPSMREQDYERYLLFLQGLFKNKSYVELAFMTGVLPIAKYSSGSPLNMFHEFNFMTDRVFDRYYGFDKTEIQEQIIEKGFKKPGLDELRLWYDGYVRMSDQEHIYNPNSVFRAFTTGFCGNYWEETGPMNEVSGLISENTADLREDILRMTAGEAIEEKLKGFSSEERQVKTRDEILSAMVVYGFLAYDGRFLRIPNHELMTKFQQALDEDVMGIHLSIEKSRSLLSATLDRKAKDVAAKIEEIHDSEMSFIYYSDENSLACVVLYAYYAAKSLYDVRREERAGKGYADFTFTPRTEGWIPIILELKYNRSANAAIRQIRERNYILRFQDAKNVLFVGINYSEKTKKHTCLIEETNYQKEMQKRNEKA